MQPTRASKDKGCKANLRSYKIKMSVTPEQRKTFMQWQEGYNWVYNRVVDTLRGVKRRVNWMAVKKGICPEKTIPECDSWVREVPSKVRSRAVQLACVAHNNGVQSGKPFELKHRSLQDDHTSTMVIDGAQRGDKGPVNSFEKAAKGCRNSKKRCALMHLAPRLAPDLGGVLLRDRNWLINRLVSKNRLEHDAKIMWHRETNSWHLIVVLSITIKGAALSVDCNAARVVSMDPGERNFNAYYCPDGTHGTVIPEMRGHIRGEQKKLERLAARVKEMRERRTVDVAEMNPDRARTRVHRRTIQHIINRMHKISKRLFERRRNGHYGAINFLLDKYDVILLPELRVKGVVGGNRLYQTTKKSIIAMGHYKFRECFQSKVQMHRGKVLQFIQEPFTSKTCGNCGTLHMALGSDSVFRCPVCKIAIDRDVNGARNNLLATFTQANVA